VASSALPITVIHLILNLSIIISTALSILVYKTEINWAYFLLGVVLMMIGVCFIELSIKYHFKNT
jgi:drug/metabolite transporter (DMT)-like permease